MTPYASSIHLAPAGSNAWAGDADLDWSHAQGQFGGWTAAVLLEAARREEGAKGDPLSLSVLFTDAVKEGPVRLSTRCLRSGARLQFWRAELSQGDKVCAHAQITFGVRRETTAFTDARAPDAPPPDHPRLVKSEPPTNFGRQLEARWLTPSPLMVNAPSDTPATSVFWARTAKQYAMDHALLACLADFAPPRVMYRRGVFTFSSTVSMNVYFHATPEELAAVGEDYVLNETVCRRCEGGYFDHELKLWSRSGALLATSEQVAAFRD